MSFWENFNDFWASFERARFAPPAPVPVPSSAQPPQMHRRGLNYSQTLLESLRVSVFGSETLSGVNVTQTSALALPPAYAAISYITDTIAMLDREVMRRKGKELFLADDHEMFHFFADAPHPYYSWFDFLAALATNACLGNGFARIHWDYSTMRPLHLELLPSHLVDIEMDFRGDLWYNVSGELGGRLVNLKLPYTEVIHIKGLTINAITGQPVSLLHKEVVSAGIAAQRYSSSILGKQARPSLAIRSADSLDIKEVETIENNIMARHSGSDKAGRPLVLDNNMEIQYLQWSPQEVALVDFSTLTIQQCAQIFKVPADMLAMPGTGTYSSTKVRSLDFLKLCIWPWKEKFEEEFNRKLFWARERASRRIYFQFNTEVMQEADRETEANTLAVLIQNSMITPNEARKRLGLNPIEGGDDLFSSIDFVPLRDLREVALAKYLSSEGEKAARLEDINEPANTAKDDTPQPTAGT